MASGAPSAEQAAALLQNLSLDSQAKTKGNLEIPEPKKPSANQIGAVDSKDANGHVAPNERSATPVLPDVMDPCVCYLPNSYQHTGFYYTGYEGNDWDEYARYVNPEGVEIPPGVYGDNGSLMYHHGFGYAPYGPYSPAGSAVPALAPDSQLYGHQQYQYPSPYFSSFTPTSGAYTPTPPAAAAPQGEVPASAAGQTPLSVDTANGNANSVSNSAGKGTNGPAPVRPTYQNSSFNSNGSYGRGALPGGILSPGYQDPRFGADGLRSPVPWMDGSIYSDGQPRAAGGNSFNSSVSNVNNALSSRNQNPRPHANMMGFNQPRPMPGLGATHGYVNRMYPNKLYGQYGNAARSGMGYASAGYDSRTNGRGWFSVDNKYKNRGRGNGYFGHGNENIDGLNELNRGPRAKSSKNQKGFPQVNLAVRGQSIPSNGNHDEEKNSLIASPDREQYNCSDFPENYTDAKFFIIKSYSEDDVHKSIKYNVWSSTPHGNKKLDAAYQEAQEITGGCPVFLFFSVNASGQFVGVAEMLGPVDFQKNVEYWQQDKWNGCFPVKWHILKDVPNSLLKHITLENNENKPVTNSRDTQEVKLEQGLQLLKIFKEHISKTCLLDDFGFYEVRQKTIQEKKAKQQQFQKQVWEGKTGEKNKDPSSVEQKLQKPVENSADSFKDSADVVASNGDAKLLADNGAVSKGGEVASSPKPVAEVNGVAHC